MTCAHAVRVAISKFEGVEDVNVSLQRGHAKVKLKPGNAVELKKVMEAVGHQALEVRQVSVSPQARRCETRRRNGGLRWVARASALR